MQKNLPDRPAMRFDQKYIGKVVDTDDPKKQLRVQIRVFGVFTDNVPDEDLPWAEYAFPPGSRENAGFVTSVEVGDYVWVDFPFSGNTRRLRMLGSVHHCPDGEPDAPHEMWLGPNAVVHNRHASEPMPAPREYYQNNVYSQDGIVVEVPKAGGGSIIVTHRATGSAIEICPTGDIVVHSENQLIMSAKSGVNVSSEISVGIDARIVVGIAAKKAIILAAPDIFLNGKVHINGGLSIAGDATGTGSLAIDGNITAGGEIKDEAGNTNNHEH